MSDAQLITFYNAMLALGWARSAYVDYNEAAMRWVATLGFEGTTIQFYINAETLDGESLRNGEARRKLIEAAKHARDEYYAWRVREGKV